MQEVSIQEDRETSLCGMCGKEGILAPIEGRFLCSDCIQDIYGD